MLERPFVCVVDDDESVRESLPDLLKEFGYAVEAFSSAKDFLASDLAPKADCLILDIAMPQMTGPDLLCELRRRGRNVPVIFITAHSDSGRRSRPPEAGVVACLLKPFSQAALFEALGEALPGRL
jgi:FixJ family two-component response regulator